MVHVQVEADRGEDIGRIVQRATELSKLQSSGGGNNDPTSPGEEPLGRTSKRHDAPVKKIIAVANQREREMLSEQVCIGTNGSNLDGLDCCD